MIFPVMFGPSKHRPSAEHYPETGFEETSGDALERAVPHHLQIVVNVHRVSAERLPGPY
jgi:hypothetical protein